MQLLDKFIAIDGPNGVGKSTVISLLKGCLTEYGVDCLFTKEPTNSLLGNFIRNNQSIYQSQTLAALVAADRYDHISKLIKPNLKKGKLVVTDRYFASSLVYQIQDGLSYEFIQSLNKEIVLPSLYFILKASVETIAGRLAGRSQLTRFEKPELLSQEIKLFEKAGALLKEKGVKVCFLDNEISLSKETAEKIASEIMRHLQQ